MAKLPKTIKVAHLDYALDLVTQDFLTVLRGQDDAIGHCSWSKQQIYVKKTLQGPQLVEVVLHEIHHAVTNTMTSFHGRTPGTEEITEMVGIGFATVFRDNPKLLKWITKELKNAGT